MAKGQGVKPGHAAPASGLYRQIGPRGGEYDEVTVPKGKTMPPAPRPGMTYDLVDPADNKSGKVD